MFGFIKGVLDKLLSAVEEFIAGYGADIMVNGSFEKGEFPQQSNPPPAPQITSAVLPLNDTKISNWKVSNQYVVWLKKGNLLNFSPGHGDYFVDFADQGHAWTGFDGGLIGGGMISDPFNTLAGRRYLLQMLIGAQVPLAIWVGIGGKFAGNLSHPGGKDVYWRSQSMVFIAPGPQTQIEIRGWIPLNVMKAGSIANNSLYLGVDNVTVQLMWRKSPVQWPVG